MAGIRVSPGQAPAWAPWRLVFSARPWRSVAYLGTGALVGFGVLLCVVFTVVAFSVLLVPLWVLVVAPLERHRLRLLGHPLLHSPHAASASGVRGWLREPATWRETAWCLLLALLGLGNAVVLMGTVVPAGLLLGSPLLYALGLLDDAGISATSWWPTLPLAGAGVLTLVAACYVWTALAAAEAALARTLLSPREEELESRLAEVVRSRITLADAFEHERRRIERDLHDGAQERLVALSLTLGLAELELAGPESRPTARELVARARAQAEEAMVALRATVRGIHPQVLTDHGLAEAVREVAGRSPVPVAVDLDVPRLPAGVESAAYFAVTEALTNAARHSGAARAEVTGRYSAEDGRLTLVMRDDGRGGARFADGGGLAGLRERVGVYGGSLAVDSPPGGPTVVTVVVPCAREGR
ncbi:signal transduction histidine kinase [Thermocatellispora tengchongensis]|uniref:histidine kinase n=1 Tax=Thermocatellispora tengchongensis TaxID=1073253 RepID=A0A840PB72_9ACTN|nr:sensor domain-containing protein [Thermocatellispora tengchongensis]MBB5135111.1 signal transduction histidine kinase [Thermocatellispora tengchongensis]